MSNKNYTKRLNALIPEHNELLKRLPHPTITNVNTSVGYNVYLPRKYAPSEWQSSYSIPKYISPSSHLVTNDIVLELPKQKAQFINELNWLKSNFGRSKKERTKNKNFVDKVINGKFGELLERDPDPYFADRLNWYFTGGTLQLVNKNDENYIYHVDGVELDNLNAFKLETASKNELCLEPIKLSIDNVKNIKKGGTIFELRRHDNDSCIIARQKYSIQALNDSGKLITITSGDIPFISAATISTKNQLVTIDAKRTIQIADLSRNGQIIEKANLNRKHLNDRWSCIRFYRKNIFSYNHRSAIFLYDTRTPIDKNSECFEYNFRDHLGSCEDITCIEHVPNTYLTYIGTTHNLFAIDTRACTKKNLKLLKWCHQLAVSPTMISILKENNSEYAAISSPANGDIRIVEALKKDGTERFSQCIPYKPKNLFDSYNYIRCQGHALLPSSRVGDHIGYSTTGILLMRPNSNSHIQLITQNSAGNIITQLLDNKDDVKENPAEVIERMTQWDTILCNQIKTPLSVTTVTNFQSMIETLKGSVDCTDDMEDIMPERQRPGWKRTINELSEYKDLLATNILQPWNLDGDVKLFQTNPHVSVYDNVKNWLDTANDGCVDLTVDVDLDLKEDINVSQILADLETSKTSKAQPTSKRKFVPGF